MADEERTEAATPRRRQKEREKGNIAKSQDMNSALVLISAVGLCIVMSPSILSKLKNLLIYTFTHLNPSSYQNDSVGLILQPVLSWFCEIVFPFMGFLFIITAFLLWTQVGSLFAIEKIKPKFDKLSPMSIWNNAKKQLNPFEIRNIVEFIKSLIKMLIVFFAGFSVVNGRKDTLFSLQGAGVETGLVIIGEIIIQMVLAICFMLIVIGYFDKKYQTYEFEKSIKMTKKEIKDEYKDVEGDPLIKSKIRGSQMKFAQQKMMAAIPQADVVVTNPTHFAVAVKYDKEKAPAPIVVAKGVDYLAFKIREVAQNNNVPIVENRPLARALYKLVPIDGAIPAELYVAVAEVLAWVYNKNRQNVPR